MSRKPRLFLPDQPQHLVVRGHSREPVLVHEEDFRYLYKCLRTAARQYALAIHAWVFMHNHIHLLVTPADSHSLPKTMQSTGRRYAQYFNRHYHRSGAVWEGRYKCCLVDTDHYLLCCYRYIELNPVRAGIVNNPGDYPYSSYRANALGKPDSMLTPHRLFLAFIDASASKSKHSGIDGIDATSATGPGYRGDPSPAQTAGVESSKKSVKSKNIDADCAGLIGFTGDRGLYRALCTQMLDRKMLMEIRLGTKKGLAIGQPAFVHRATILQKS